MIVHDKTKSFHNWIFEAQRQSSNELWRYGFYMRSSAEAARNDMIRCGWIVTDIEGRSTQTVFPNLNPAN